MLVGGEGLGGERGSGRTAEDELRFGGGEVGDGVEGVGLLPGFEGVAPRVADGAGERQLFRRTKGAYPSGKSPTRLRCAS